MSFRNLLSVLVFAVSIVVASDCQAQWRSFSQPGQKPIRLLGHGWSAGYHWRNPGHDSSYYNPYSSHNSQLKSHWEYGFQASSPQLPHPAVSPGTVTLPSTPSLGFDFETGIDSSPDSSNDKPAGNWDQDPRSLKSPDALLPQHDNSEQRH